jgi:hypothetical protein
MAKKKTEKIPEGTMNCPECEHSEYIGIGCEKKKGQKTSSCKVHPDKKIFNTLDIISMKSRPDCSDFKKKEKNNE